MGRPPVHLLSSRILGEWIESAHERVVVAIPGVHEYLAAALMGACHNLEGRVLAILDPGEECFRLGFGEVNALRILLENGVPVVSKHGLRLGCALVDDCAFMFAASPLLVEREPLPEEDRSNAWEISVREAEAYFQLLAAGPELANALTGKPNSVVSVAEAAPVVTYQDFAVLEDTLKQNPPMKFDIARQTRVYTARVQHIEIEKTGTQLSRKKISIPKSLRLIAATPDLAKKLATSVSVLEDYKPEALDQIDQDLKYLKDRYAPDFLKPLGRIVLRSQRPEIEKKLEQIKANLTAARTKIEADITSKLESMRKEISDLCLAAWAESERKAGKPPQAEDLDSRQERILWDLDRVLPKAEELLDEMKLTWSFKDVTYETLNSDSFFKKIKAKFPKESKDWDKAYNEFLAAKATGDSNLP